MTVSSNPFNPFVTPSYRATFNWKNVAKYGFFHVDARFGGSTARVVDARSGRTLKTFCSDGRAKAKAFAWKKFTASS